MKEQEIEVISEVQKRGRPKKEAASLHNEKNPMTTMAQKPNAQSLESGVGVVHDAMQKITLDDIQNRWKSVFSKYSSLGFDGIMQSWGQQSALLNNPYIQNARVKKINAHPSDFDSDQLDKMLEDPENNEANLRSASMGLYYANYIYMTLIQLGRHIPKYNHYATPLYIEGSGKDKLSEDSIRVDKILKRFNPQLTFKTVATQVNIEGKCSYLVRTSYDKKDINYLLLQKLSGDHCKITGFGSRQQFITSFNMAIFLEAGFDVCQYPQFIRDTWEQMLECKVVVRDKKGVTKINPRANLPKNHIIETGKDGGFMYWVQLPQDLCWTFYADGSHPNCFPETIGLFEDLNSLSDYRWLQTNLLTRGVNSILTAEVPITKDAKAGADMTAISVDSILGFTDWFNQNVSGNVMPFFAPFNDYKLHSIDSQPEALDVIYDRVRDLIATSGLGGILPITDKPSIASVKAQEYLQASKHDYLTRQFEQFLNDVINRNFDLHYDWSIKLWGDIFFEREDQKFLKEMVLSGANGFLGKLLSSHGHSLEDYKGQTIYLDALDIKIEREGELIEEKNPVGRPRLDDEGIENDNTAISSGAGNNVSEIKEFSTSHKCMHCGAEIFSEYNIKICDDCLQTLIDERELE